MQRRGIGTSERRRAAGLAACLGFLALLLLAGTPLAAEAPAKKPPGDGPVYIKLPPIVLPVLTEHALRQETLTLNLELVKGKTEEDVVPRQPVLYDAFMADLYNLYDQHSGDDRIIDPVQIKDMLQQTSDRVLGPGIVQSVLIQQVFERSRRR